MIRMIRVHMDVENFIGHEIREFTSQSLITGGELIDVFHGTDSFTFRLGEEFPEAKRLTDTDPRSGAH